MKLESLSGLSGKVNDSDRKYTKNSWLKVYDNSWKYTLFYLKVYDGQVFLFFNWNIDIYDHHGVVNTTIWP